MDIDKEKELCNKFVAGNSEAFGEIYNYYYPKLLNYIYRRTMSRTTSEDIVANVFLKALDNIKKFKWGPLDQRTAVLYLEINRWTTVDMGAYLVKPMKIQMDQ